MEEEFEVLPLHRNKHFTMECCNLINSQWTRSEGARLQSLEASCDNFPTSLVLIKNEKNNCKTVIGHSKISLIPSIPDSGFVETVVIAHDYRGKGMGKYLMYKTEEYMKMLNLNTVYLSTINEQGFYNRLGYEKCQPITIYGGFLSTINKLTTGSVNIPTRKTFMKKQLI